MVMNGKDAGTTSVVVWDENGTMFSYDVTVAGDAAMLNQIRDRLAKVLPKEKFTVVAVGAGFAISGVVANKRAKKVALEIGEAYAPKKVVDNISVEDIPPQIVIKVHFAEIIKSEALQLG
jgi:pilus assembly protein CpaC